MRRQDDTPSVSTGIEGVRQTTYGSLASVKSGTGNADDDGRMIAAPMVALAALYVGMRCATCGLCRREHVRGMNPIGNRSCEAFTGRGR